MQVSRGGDGVGVLIVRKVRLFAGISCAALAIACWLPAPAAAQVNVWTGTTSNDWTVGSNWST